MTRKEFVELLARNNEEFYGTRDGRTALRAFELTFEHRWIYVFELVQNALDAGATSIKFRLSDNAETLTVQHDGLRPIEEENVEGLSKVFRSTKGATSVGFMGIGFKSVFGRFREVRVSGWDWTFRYEMSQVVGEEYGDLQIDPLGAVLPIWDDGISEPELGFTTRFELSKPIGPATDLQSDLDRLLSDDDPTLLAVLAASNLERLDVEGQVWTLSIDDGAVHGSMTAMARSDGKERGWRLFPIEFKPSQAAIRRFLEYRKIQPTKEEREQVYAAAARVRRVLGILPLDDRGVPAPPQRGRVYATLPTEVTLPLGVHVNADWLLNISRTGLGELEDDPWQRDIVDRIADVLASVLGWVACMFSEPDAAKAAFAALASPSPEAGGLEAILAEERWLSRLRDLLENASVIPVWAEETDALGFAKPREVIVPPVPFAQAFENQPTLRPAALMKGPVLIHRVLGKSGCQLLHRAGLLAEMSSSDLEQAWAGGLESWWEELEGEESTRRDLLFRVWGFVSELTSDSAWSTNNLLCIRTAGGAWRSVGESVFFNEPLPSEREPSGPEVRRFLEPVMPGEDYCLAEDWSQMLRQSARRERWEKGYLSHAWEWIETHARSIGLRELVESTVNRLDASSSSDRSALVALGRWAAHRNRPDLLLRVLVESATGRRGVPVADALLAEPYVRGQSRGCLFPNTPVISATYLEEPETADPKEWRTFFEAAGAKGALAVRSIEYRVNRWQRRQVAEFLELESEAIGNSNNSGYVLRDFDIEPYLPDANAPTAMQALAAWLDDNFSKLRNKGRREVEYCYRGSHSRRGELPSAWAVKLSNLEWVPCRDNQLRRPRDVLREADPSREDAPVAVLSGDLMSVLEQEGVRFGIAIPDATELQRLLNVGSELPAEELAALLREVREQVETDEDKLRFEQAMSELAFPSEDNERIPLARIVRRVGGRLRGTLGGRIAPFDRFHERLREEWEHPAFPHKFPETTTGKQALAYLREVWARARSSPDRLANEVRNVLPTAYAYCLEDMSDNVSLAERWNDIVRDAAVFDGREWIYPSEEKTYFDDIEDRRFFPEQGELRTATAGHLGNSPEQRLRTAQKLGLERLSAIVELNWSEGTERAADAWAPRFKLICQLLRHVKGSGRMEQEEEGEAGIEPTVEWRLRRVGRLDLEVSVEGGPPVNVPVNARLRGDDLTVAGRSIQFGADAAKELLRALSFGQRADLSADLTAMLNAIDAADDFALASEKFRRSFAHDFQMPTAFQGYSGVEEATGPQDDPAPTADSDEPISGRWRDADEWGPQENPSSDSRLGELDQPDGVLTDETQDGTPDSPEHGESGPMGGPFSRDRALALQKRKAEELKNALKGEITPDSDSDDSSGVEEGGVSTGGLLGDEVYREVTAQYERVSGRNPEYGDPHQEGWDLRSVDPETGAIRLIEVKGRGRLWDGDEVVELSRAQVHKAFELSDEQAAASWYLYVVERTDDGSYEVLPIENPVHIAGKWILCGGPWRLVAAERRRITLDLGDKRLEPEHRKSPMGAAEPRR